MAETPDQLTLQIGTEQLQLTDLGLPKVQCSCPALDTCRHILLTGLWLRDLIVAPAELPPFPTFTLDDLIQWAGKKTVTDGINLFAQNPDVTISPTPLTVQFLSLNVTARFLSLDLAASICSCKARQPCDHRIAAILCHQAHQGNPIALPETLTPKPKPTQTEILPQIAQFLEEIVELGLCRLSEATRQRCLTLASAALDLPRLAKSLRSIATEIDLLLRRDAQADSANLLAQLARTYALTDALATNPHPDLIGQHRSQYDNIGRLELIGLAAYHWQTSSKYAGFTLLFWDNLAKSWNSWSDIRPLAQGFRPEYRYSQPMPWSGLPIPNAAMGKRLQLQETHRNPQRRLSSSLKTQALILGEVDLQAIDFGNMMFDHWESLENHIKQHQFIGLRIANPLDSMVILEPTIWGKCQFDAVNQQLLWPIFDRTASPLFLRVPYHPEDEHRIQALEKLTNPEGRIIARIDRINQQLFAYPIALLTHQVLNLGMPQQQTTVPAAVLGESTDDEVLEPELENFPTSELALHHHIRSLLDLTQSQAERGTQQPPDSAQCKRLIAIFETAGIPSVATILQQLDSHHNQASLLLRLNYLGQLITQ
ncbi:MAG: hypothetical protein HC860_27000 [Alkalinema sp. RU_4_3]|nr:hypothetical protein [Alkalinema sp. RU_4_3]